MFAKEQLEAADKFLFRTQIAQAYGLVQPGLIMARHVFCGLNRGIYDASNVDQGPNKLIYCWKPNRDCVWHGSGDNGVVLFREAPANKVFVVIVTLSPAVIDGDVSGWIERWNWVNEDRLLPEAPIDHKERYREKIWTRDGI